MQLLLYGKVLLLSGKKEKKKMTVLGNMISSNFRCQKENKKIGREIELGPGNHNSIYPYWNTFRLLANLSITVVLCELLYLPR